MIAQPCILINFNKQKEEEEVSVMICSQLPQHNARREFISITLSSHLKGFVCLSSLFFSLSLESINFNDEKEEAEE